MCHRSSTVVLSAKDGMGVPFTPVEKVRKMFFTLYGSSLLPRKFQHLCMFAGWIGNPQSSLRLKGLPSPRPSAPWHSMHFFSTKRLAPFSRSEEHTSELQSRPHLVCRLLLEKKKKPLDRVI